ncbi:calcium-binding protein, partial [Phenylobacterium sp.]|uniref:calcium-binding protein n=1 Tax=Phenylobacterium sp. TaxID=1871053 RepID=UPI002F0F3B38
TWTYSGTHTVTQAEINSGANIVNTATADSDQTGPDEDDAVVTVNQTRTISIDKYVTQVGSDTTAPFNPVSAAGQVINYGIDVTNTGNITQTGLTVTDSIASVSQVLDINGKNVGDANTNGAFDPGETWKFSASYTVTAGDIDGNGGGDADIDNTATADTDQADSVQDSAAVAIFAPVTITGNPQFNFPNSVDSIQPKLQGGTFAVNAGGYIYWDFFTSNDSLAKLATSGYSTDYAGLKISIQKIWNEGTSTGDAIYRVYVANETGAAISLNSAQKIASYTVTALSTNKGLVDLVNADPIIGNFNNFNNIENALLKDATDLFETNGAAAASGASIDRVWASLDETGTKMDDPAFNFDALAGNDAVYGGSNTTPGAAGDNLAGGEGADLLDGRAGNDSLNGGDGNDYLYGGLGDDTIVGGAGNDFIFGSYGSDLLSGGPGGAGDQDIFVLRLGDFDEITDFNPNEDKIWLWIDSLDSTPAAGATALTVDANGNLVYNNTLVGHINVASLSASDYLVT